MVPECQRHRRLSKPPSASAQPRQRDLPPGTGVVRRGRGTVTARKKPPAGLAAGVPGAAWVPSGRPGPGPYGAVVAARRKPARRHQSAQAGPAGGCTPEATNKSDRSRRWRGTRPPTPPSPAPAARADALAACRRSQARKASSCPSGRWQGCAGEVGASGAIPVTGRPVSPPVSGRARGVGVMAAWLVRRPSW